MLTFPTPIPTLTRVHTLNSLETAEVDFDAFLQQHITLLILGTFENSSILLEGANKLCIQNTANSKQRVLWINSVEQMVALKAKIETALQQDLPEKVVDFNNIRALSMMPKVTYIIFIDPSKSPDPKDKRKKISVFQMQRAFNAAIKALPITITPNPTPEV